MTMFYYREVDAQGVDGNPRISMIEYRVVSRTKRGVWIAPTWDYDAKFKRFVLDGNGRRFAYPTKDLARASYIRRKQREIQHCARQHDKAKYLLHFAENGSPPQPTHPCSIIDAIETRNA